jgi:hypothetical protein
VTGLRLRDNCMLVNHVFKSEIFAMELTLTKVLTIGFHIEILHDHCMSKY